MKKLMIACAVVAMAMASQAAKITWSADGLLDKAGITLDESSYATFAVQCVFWDSTGETIKITDTGSVNALGTATGTWAATEEGGPAINTSYYAQLTITDKDGATLISEKAFLTTSGSSTYSINFATGNGFDPKTSKIVNTGKDYGWTNVPEPTSGLLLLLGVAGLALRRRRA